MKCGKSFLIFFFIGAVVLILNLGCVSQYKETEKNSKALPAFPYVVGAKSYFYAASAPMISLLAKAYNIAHPLLIKNIGSIAVSFTDSGIVVFVRTTSNINISQFSKRVRLMKRIKAVALDEDELNWRIENADKEYIVNIAYSGALVLSDAVTIKALENFEFLTQFPKELSTLEVHDDYALWFWVSMNMFDNTFISQKIRGGHGAVAISEYTVSEDISADFVFPYDGKRSDFATLKLVLPFLFKSFGADILASLPDISFVRNMVVIRGVNLPLRTIQALTRTVTNKEKKR